MERELASAAEKEVMRQRRAQLVKEHNRLMDVEKQKRKLERAAREKELAVLKAEREERRKEREGAEEKMRLEREAARREKREAKQAELEAKAERRKLREAEWEMKRQAKMEKRVRAFVSVASIFVLSCLLAFFISYCIFMAYALSLYSCVRCRSNILKGNQNGSNGMRCSKKRRK